MFAHRALYPIWLALTHLVSQSSAVLRTYNLTVHSDLRSPDGFSREAYLINGQLPGPLIEADEGDTLQILVKNDLPVDTALHWHGILQQGSPDMDGVPGVTQNPIPPGGNFTYRFSVKDQYGFFWYHSHVRAYYNDGIRGPLLIRPSPSRSRPFEKLARSQQERDILLHAERYAHNVLLHDWNHEPSDAIYAQYLKTGAFPFCVDSILANGFGKVECLPEYILQDGPGLGLGQEGGNQTFSTMMDMPMAKRMRSDMDMDHPASLDTSGTVDTTLLMSIPTSTTTMTAMESSSGMSDISMSSTMTMSGMPPSMTPLSPRGCMTPMMFKPGFNASSLPPETCTNTTSPLLTIPADHMSGWLALNLVNSGAVSRLRVSLDAHSMLVYAADGWYVDMQEVKVLEIDIGQRYSVMIGLDQKPGNYYLRFATYPDGDMQQVLEGKAVVSYNNAAMDGKAQMHSMVDSAAVWMLPNGSAKAGVSELSPQRLSPFPPINPPSGPAAQTHSFTINQTGIVTWVVNNAPYSEAEIPIIRGNTSDGWQANTTIHMPFNSTIDIIMRIANDSMDTMGHPMHLHGHHFWVLGSGTGSFPYNSVTDAPRSLINLQNPPYRDTTNLPPSGWAVIRYVTDNPGAWIFHCHIQWHMVSGMALVLVEGQDKIPGLIGESTSTATMSSAIGQFRSRDIVLAAMTAGFLSMLW
ncbi:Cupredoxin [Aspergillus lucknowensis]|uniref:Cupredoxin n=1 Tax=Aspergillus lucknowensis TaxID=176173 RepID=A0ABR4M4A6_9EURO